MENLRHKKILIIGGTSGFGKKVAELTLKAGAAVTVTGRDETKNNQVVNELSSYGTLNSHVFVAKNEQSFQILFRTLGKFDQIVSMLGGAMGGGFLSATTSEIEQTIHDKFTLNLYLARAASTFLSEKGSLILTSGAGHRSDLASGAIVGNGALNELVRGLALELAPEKRVNAVAPSWTPTGLWRTLTAEQKESFAQAQASANPLKRVASIEEVAKAYLFLMDCSFINGQTLTIDGGESLK